MDVLAWLGSHIDGIDDVRDALYVALGIPALALLWWRSASANRQARAALEQAKAAQEQSALAQAHSLTNLFQSATDMLGSEVAAVRIGGIHALARLAKHRPEEFHIRVMQLFLAFLCNPPADSGGLRPGDGGELPPGDRDDIQTILRLLKLRSDSDLELEKRESFQLYLRGARLSRSALRMSKFARAHFVQVDISHAYAEGADFSHSSLEHCDLRHGRFGGCNFFLALVLYSALSNSNFRGVNFHRVNMHFADLSKSDLKYAKLTRAHLSAVDFRESDLEMADLSGATITPGRRMNPDGELEEVKVPCLLTQEQLNQTLADPAHPPEIRPGSIDAGTGLELVWSEEHGKRNWERLLAQQEAERARREAFERGDAPGADA